MTEHDAFPSNYLGKDDLTEPVTGIIAAIDWRELNTDDGGKERKPVLFFQHEQFKPLILNRINWRTLADAYGQDSDDWQNRNVEIFVDPNVTFGLRRVGGVRVRIPSSRPTNGHARPLMPAQPRSAPTTPLPSKRMPPPADDGPPEKTAHEAHSETLALMATATTMEYRNKLIVWRKQWTVDAQEQRELEDALHAPLGNIDKDIPF